MLYLFLRLIVLFLYFLGVWLVHQDYLNLYLLLGIYLLVFIIHIVHLKHFKKESLPHPDRFLIIDILIFGMVPIWQWNKKTS